MQRVPTINRPRWWQLPRRRRRELLAFWRNHQRMLRRLSARFDMRSVRPDPQPFAEALASLSA